jgi:hypothetical protein
LTENPGVRGVVVVQSETSSGVLNDVKAIGAIVREHPECVFIVDSITGIGAVECKTDEWGLDVVMTGSQKGLMLPPGLAALTVSPKAWRAYERSTLPKFYFDWAALQEEPREGDHALHPAGLAHHRAGGVAAHDPRGGHREHHRPPFAPGRGDAQGLRGARHEALRSGRRTRLAVTPVWVPEGVDGKPSSRS